MTWSKFPVRNENSFESLLSLVMVCTATTQSVNLMKKWNTFLVPGSCGMVLPLIIQELLRVGFAFSLISVGQWIILILGQISEVQLANTKDVNGSKLCALFSLSYTLFTCTPNPSMSLFPCDVALKSHSFYSFIKLVEQIVYFCLKCWPAPSLNLKS